MNSHHTKLKGDIGLISVVKDLISRGFYVSLPISENTPFDLIASDQKVNYRVQVKARSLRKGSLEVQFRTSWNDKAGTHYSRYANDDFDVLAVYAIEEDVCLYLTRGKAKSITIRFETAKNNQKSGVNNWFDFRSFPPSETIRGAPKDEDRSMVKR